MFFAYHERFLSNAFYRLDFSFSVFETWCPFNSRFQKKS